ncbi:MAG: hypothetical protein IIW63_06895 [Clostridia bacterium]|nr:hypothetical protein [Clostridia bacterium]
MVRKCLKVISRTPSSVITGRYSGNRSNILSSRLNLPSSIAIPAAVETKLFVWEYIRRGSEGMK